jgi:MipA family protein
MRLSLVISTLLTGLVALSAQASDTQEAGSVTTGYTNTMSRFYLRDGDKALTVPETSTWYVRAGAGLLGAPGYEGSDEYAASVLPVVDVRYGQHFFLNNYEGLGVNFLQQDGLRAGARLRYRFGRSEGFTRRLRGTGEVDDWAELGLFVSQRVGLSGGSFALFSADIYQDVTSGEAGTYGHITGEYGLPLNEHLFSSLGASVGLASDDYMESFFGVNGTQATRSGLPRYSAGAGVKDITFSSNTAWEYNENWFLTVNAAYQMLMEDAADSPIVGRGEEQQLFGGAFVTHKF